MMLRRPLILFLLVALFACNPDLDKDITTDLQVEGNEIFRVSFALEESYYLAFQNLDAYRNVDTLSLPGCPDILINESERKVTLDFDVERDCPAGNSISRKGKIHLEFLQTGTFERITRLSYENYEVKNFRIEGTREFRQLLNFSRRTERFSDLLVLDQFGSSTRLNGEYEFTLSFENGTLLGIEASGSLNGRNITGRPLQMEPINPKKYQVSCILSGYFLPSSGRETWRIFTNATLSTTHSLNYEADPGCQNKAIVDLSDGRQVIFEQ